MTGGASIAATVATIVAAIFAVRAYNAASEAVFETRRQANIAQETLVTSTRARLKLMSVGEAPTIRSPSGVVAWFNFKPTYKNFGQSPAQNIMFHPHVFVVGAGPAPEPTCEKDKAFLRGFSTEIIFPQDEGGGQGIGVQVPLDEIETQADKVRAVQPTAPIYLGIIGCLTYRSTGSAAVYVTGFVGNLHLADEGQTERQDYVPLYDVLMESDDPLEIGMTVRTLSAWAD